MRPKTIDPKKKPTSKPKWSRSVHYFDKRRSEEVARMLTSDKESDRGCVIFGAAILEDGLEQLLRAACRTDDPSAERSVDSLFQTYAPFSTFSAKIQVTYALGLIPKDLKEILDLVRKLRNDFAHQKGSTTFQTPEHQPRLQAFRKALDPAGHPREPDPDDHTFVPAMGATKRQVVERLAFCLRIAHVSGRISAYIAHARRISRKRSENSVTRASLRAGGRG